MPTATELFAGAGGAAIGIASVPGVRIVTAANHLAEAVESYRANHSDVDVRCADISQVDPRSYPGTDILWASPSCTHHSKAQGKPRHRQPDLFSEPVSDDAAERSRATMWDVIRFAEHHRYRLIYVENVVEVRYWLLWPAWRQALTLLGYDVNVLCLNSMFAGKLGQPAPQDRNRVIIVAVRRGERMLDLDRWIRPAVHCGHCGRSGLAVQAWKDPQRRYGVYGPGGQYLWRCPTKGCHQVVHPPVLPAASFIDWLDTGTVIADRTRPLVPATLRRIGRSLARLGIVDPTNPVADRHMLVPYYGTGTAALTTEPIRTVPTKDRFALVSRDGADVEGRTYRMLTVPELKAAMAFPSDYHLAGRPKVQKLMLGNAVPPPLSRDLLAAGVEALTGEDVPDAA